MNPLKRKCEFPTVVQDSKRLEMDEAASRAFSIEELALKIFSYTDIKAG